MLPVIRRLTAVMVTDYDLKMSKVITEMDGTLNGLLQSGKVWGANNQRRDLVLNLVGPAYRDAVDPHFK